MKTCKKKSWGKLASEMWIGILKKCDVTWDMGATVVAQNSFIDLASMTKSSFSYSQKLNTLEEKSHGKNQEGSPLVWLFYWFPPN